MTDVQEFVRERLAEGTLPERVCSTYTALLELSEKVRGAGRTDDWLSWLTGASAVTTIGEYVFGADPASTANRVADDILAAMARAWSTHEAYDPEWEPAP